jgi:hypothetical protein
LNELGFLACLLDDGEAVVLLDDPVLFGIVAGGGLRTALVCCELSRIREVTA